MLPNLRALHVALDRGPREGADQRVLDTAWGYLADACEAAAKSEGLTCDSESGAFIKSTLLEASQHPEPRPSENDGQFDRHQSWGGGQPRLDGARGIIRLAANSSCIDQAVFEAIERLSADRVPAVKYQIAERLTSLYYSAPELMWKLLERISRDETSTGVLIGLIHGSLDRLAAYHPDRIADLVRIIFDRVRGGEGSDEVRKGCSGILVGLYVWRDQVLCSESVAAIANNPVGYSVEAHQIVFSLRDWLNLGLAEHANANEDEVRRRSFDLMQRVLDATLSQTRWLQSKNVSLVDSPWSEADQTDMTTLARLADSICMQVYFASGAFSGAQVEDKVPRGEAERTRYLEYARPLMETLSEFGYPSLTHHLLQTLEYLLPFGPYYVFLLIVQVVRNGRKGGYQYESMAIELIVRVVERFIAEFSQLLQEKEACRSGLIEILDTFVDAGWPSARRLTYRLEEIYQ